MAQDRGRTLEKREISIKNIYIWKVDKQKLFGYFMTDVTGLVTPFCLDLPKNEHVINEVEQRTGLIS